MNHLLLRAGLVLGLLTVFVATSRAAPPAPASPIGDVDRAAAQAAFRVGAQAFRANRFAVAAQSFEEAHERDPRPETAFSIAQANRLQYYVDRLPWRVQRAVQLYRWYLEQLPSGPRAADASGHLGELEPLLDELRRRGEMVPFVAPVKTQLVIGAEVDRAEIRIDGKPAQLWQPVEVTAGPHVIELVAPGFEPARRRVEVAAGSFLPIDMPLRAKPGRLIVRTEPGAELYVDGRRSPALPVLVTPGEHFVSVTRRGRESWSRIVAVGRDQQVELDAALAPTGQRRVARWVLGTAALTGLAAGGVELWAYSARRDAAGLDQARRELSATPADLARYNDHVTASRDRRAIALALGTAALGIGAIGAGMWYFDREAPGDTRVGLQPVIGAEQIGATLVGSF